MEKELTVNGKAYSTIKLLGKGKGGYSYLVRDKEKKYVLKQIHHEPCVYYQFSNKIEEEIRDYNKLKAISIRMPIMYEVDIDKELILKDEMKTCYVEQLKDICALLYQSNLNIDCFPTNFVVNNDLIYYIDFECNTYMEEWN